MRLTINIQGLAAMQQAMRQVPDVARRELLAACWQAAMLLQREWSDRTPRVTGALAGSIKADASATPTGAFGRVASSSPVAQFVELGTRPHMPPVSALVPWVRAVLGIQEPKELERVAYLVARKIARCGTPAQRLMQQAVDACGSQIAGIFDAAAERLAAAMGRRA